MKFKIVLIIFFITQQVYSFGTTTASNLGDSLIYKKPNEKHINVWGVTYMLKKNGYYSGGELKHEKDFKSESELSDSKIYEEKSKFLKKSKGAVDTTYELKTDDKKAYNLFNTLKKCGYVDTVNKIFGDKANTIFIEAVITNSHYYTVSEKNAWGSFKPTSRMDKLFFKWYVKNTYNEVIDSFQTQGLSAQYDLYDNYDYSQDYKERFYKKQMKAQEAAVTAGFFELYKNKKFMDLLAKESTQKISDNVLALTEPTNKVSSKDEGSAASVIVKTKNGHGSGFAITNDGYIITNYHVISEEYYKKRNNVTIIKSNGESIDGKIIRVNKFKDLALIKAETQFEKSFLLPNAKSYEKFMNVYTVGTPKSIELGQSISSGVISNERNTLGNQILQLGISVNRGNSGGPLFDQQGRLHGVIVAKLFGENTEGVGFAIPAYLIKEYMNLK